MKNTTRRHFLKASTAVSSFQILPSGLLANSPNGRVCTAHIGTGGKGRVDTGELVKHERVQAVGFCDVDRNRGQVDSWLSRHKSAKFFQDYREMLGTLGDKVDVVSISTPDHTHYPATMEAMKLGKHVYTQKPLTHKLAEARELATFAAEKNLTTQMGIQNQSRAPYRFTRHHIKEGIIGKIKRLYVWSFKNWGYDGKPYSEKSPIPKSLDWNLWLGTAPVRPFVDKVYHPGQWRKILDFGCGTIGDMGIHIFDTPFKSLDLSDPLWVEAECRAPNAFGHAEKNRVRYGFAPTKYTTNDFTFTWWDGTGAPRHDGNPDLQLPNGDQLPSQGALYVGEAGRMVLPHCKMPTFYPEAVQNRINKNAFKSVNHYTQFLDAIEGKDKTLAGFEYAGPLAESLCLGVVACQFPGQRLNWDAKKMRVTNFDKANPLLEGKYRKF
jgi:predicted dehydrogenase